MFSPVNASHNIVEKYLRYLNTTFSLDDPEYEKLFKAELKDQRRFYKGPYLDVNDSFRITHSIEDLINEGILAKSFVNIGIQNDRMLYEHQLKAIKKAMDNRNVVVSTGTGSGKTESFLIPMLDHACRLSEQGLLEPGVTALIVYPMNALANDQIERLRNVLKNYPEITFGAYTGQTEKKYNKALEKFIGLNNFEPIPNELISREQMHQTPPNILITNYSMLEYLMLRPESSVFFEPVYTKNWKYIVLDEAHVYSGSTGIEVSFLLRRLKARLNKENIQYILTSATLGSEEEDKDVAEFASDLCSAHFDEKDVVRATRITPKPEFEVISNNQELYVEFNNLFLNERKDELLDELNQINHLHYEKAEEALYDFFLHDQFYWKLRDFMFKPRTVLEISKEFAYSPLEIESFVNLASKAIKNEIRLFDARYHMFIKAPDSVYITLPPLKRVFLERRTKHYENDIEYSVFEISTCQFCHAIYLRGSIDNNKKRLSHEKNEEDTTNVLFLLKDHYSNDDDDSDDATKLNEYLICPYCGKIESAHDKQAEYCEHPIADYVKVIRVGTNKYEKLNKCFNCENTANNGALRSFYTGQEAVTSVISTALYEELPSQKIIQTKNESTGKGFGSNRHVPTIQSLSKQFLAFSDSRQDAALFASYLDNTYQNLLNRRLIVKSVNEFKLDYPIPFDDFTRALTAPVRDYNSQRGVNPSITAAKAMFNELFRINSDNALVKRNLLKLNFNINEDFDELGLNAKELNHLCMIMAESMMLSNAIYINSSLYPFSDDDYEYFAYSTYLPSFSYSDKDKTRNLLSFIPATENTYNKRFDYIKRLLEAKGLDSSKENVLAIARLIFDGLKSLQILKLDHKSVGYKIDPAKFVIEKDMDFYQCDKCLSFTSHNISNVCPNYKCNGHLHKVDEKETFKDNHYYRLYTELDPYGLNVVEHTAQLTSEKAFEFQKEFIDKKINVLSCSTTFEMGVDVGTLETVFLRNMPPSPANYAQRAGRAGRSTQSAAFAITFCNKSSHDYTYFNNPVSMIKGSIRPPKFNVNNDKIAIRHVYASALSMFWYKYPEYFNNVEDFVRKGGIEHLEAFLNEKPENLKQYLLEILSEDLIRLLDIENFGWLDTFFQENGPINLATNEYKYSITLLEEAYEELTKKIGVNSFLVYRMNTLKREKIISFLANHNVLPKYGFPVDTVELKISTDKNEGGLGLDLSRDLSVAISEYAPGSQVVANGNIVTSRYINKMPQLGWKTFVETKCSSCNTLNIEEYATDSDIDDLLIECKACHDFLKNPKNKVIVPTFGFSTDQKIFKAGVRKPNRSSRSEIFYVGHRINIQDFKLNIPNTDIHFAYSERDKLATLNYSEYYVCELCGYAEEENKVFRSYLEREHNTPSGRTCKNKHLNKYKLGYTFETDVLHLRFTYPDIESYGEALSILNGILEGISYTLNIERQDIGGSLKFSSNELTQRNNLQLVIFDKTPGGSGYVKQISNEKTLIKVFENTLMLMKSCDCGGELMNTSCYSCLRNYQNQYQHEFLVRGYVVNFFDRILNKDEYDRNHLTSNWFTVKKYIFNEDINDLIRLIENDISVAPIVGYEFSTEQYSEAELVWIDYQLAVITHEQVIYEELIKGEGFDIIIFDKNKIEEIAEIIKGVIYGAK